jgi:pyruvate formate lyase activating enzyme
MCPSSARPEDGALESAVVVGGLQPHSLIDFPGIVACVVFTRGCNFRCPFCHNPQMVEGDGPPQLGSGQVWDFLGSRRSLLEGVVVSGGEPLIQPGIADFCGRLRSLGFRIKLDTNGSRPEVLAQLLQAGLVDYVAMDLKTLPEAYARLWPGGDPEMVRRSLELIMASGVDYEFRTTCVRPLVDEQVMRRLAHLVQGARRYALQRFRGSGAVLQPEAFSARGAYAACDEDQMLRFEAILAPVVGRCLLR